jgi:gluconolactonase
MRNTKILSILISALVFSAVAGSSRPAASQSASFVAQGASPQPINFDLGGAAAGGPSVDAAGNVYFSLTQLQPKTGSIEKWTWADGKVTKYRDVDGAAIGTMIDTQGRLLVGEWGAERITADDMKGNIVVLVDSIDGRKLLDPNALAVDHSGGIYFTESGNAKTSGADFSGIDYILPDGKTVKQVAKVPGARKVILSPDGKVLIVGGTGGALLKFDVQSGGSITNQTTFCAAQCANPVAFDENSNVYMVSDKLYVYNLKSERLAAIDMPQRFSNGAFAGKDRRTLFLSGHDGIFTLQMTVKGAPTAIDIATGKK